MAATTCARAAHPSSATWHAPFLAMLPAIQRQIRPALVRRPPWEQEEIMQAVIAYAAVAYARLAARGREQLAYPSPLARYGLKYYRSGRLVGSPTNARDACSKRCQRQRGCRVDSLQEWQETVLTDRRSTPAEIAALRMDFSAWFTTLSLRDQRLAKLLAVGESTGRVAQMLRITSGRVSQLRRELYASWVQFTGDAAVACG